MSEEPTDSNNRAQREHDDISRLITTLQYRCDNYKEKWAEAEKALQDAQEQLAAQGVVAERTATFFCQNAGYICENCRKHKYKHLGDDLRCHSSSQPLCAISDPLKDPKYLADVKALEAFVAGDCGHGQVVQNGCRACEARIGHPLTDASPSSDAKKP